MNTSSATPLAQDFITLARSPDRDSIFLGSPSLASSPAGRLVSSYEYFGPKAPISQQCHIMRSDDGGRTWAEISLTDVMWGSLFYLDDVLYMIGNHRVTKDIVITRSDDDGSTWTPSSTLFTGRYTNAPTSIVIHDGILYRAFENCAGPTGWRSLVVAADIQADLMNPKTWRMSNEVEYPGTPIELNRGYYLPDPVRKIAPDGWLEGNVISIHDQLKVLLRVRMGGQSITGMCAVCNLTDTDGRLHLQFACFHPMPGAQCKFHIIYDTVSRLFWTATTSVVDSFRAEEALWERGFKGSPGNVRRILMLHYSVNALNWFSAGCVAMSRNPLESFSYTSQLIVGNDILILSRTSLKGLNQHDTNLITLHRINDFRSLALDLRPDCGEEA